MSPLEKEIDTLVVAEPNTPKTTLIFKAIEDDLFADRHEALEYLKKLMQDENIWIEISKAKNPKKDKKYQRTIDVLKLLEECS